MPRLSLALLVAAAALAPTLASAQNYGYPGQGGAYTVTCESQDGGYRECSVGFRGTAAIVENLSDTRCVEGVNWGNTGRGTVWVRSGCRARFAEADGRPWGSGGGIPVGPGGGIPVGPGGGGVPVGPGGQGYAIRCESDDGRYRECALPSRGDAVLQRQLSDTPCVEGRNWGQRGGGRVWVNAGCRGEFAASGGGWNGGGGWNTGGGGGWGGDSVVCSSEDQRTVTCPWNARQGRPRLLDQLSDAACREGYSWGTTRSGDLWVSRGCRGRFGR